MNLVDLPDDVLLKIGAMCTIVRWTRDPAVWDYYDAHLLPAFACPWMHTCRQTAQLAVLKTARTCR